MFGVADERPTAVDDMIMPVPAHGVKVISIGMLKPKRDQVVAWRGPILDRALVQMLADVYWGDLDVLLLDLPPGTGDIAISVGQRLTSAEVIVVTTPQEAAAEVAERAGTMAQMVHQRVAGVIENMSFLPCPHCGPEHRIEIFGSGGGARVAETLSAAARVRHPAARRGPAGRAPPQRWRHRAAAGDGEPGDPGGPGPRARSPTGSAASPVASSVASSASPPSAAS